MVLNRIRKILNYDHLKIICQTQISPEEVENLFKNLKSRNNEGMRESIAESEISEASTETASTVTTASNVFDATVAAFEASENLENIEISENVEIPDITIEKPSPQPEPELVEVEKMAEEDLTNDPEISGYETPKTNTTSEEPENFSAIEKVVNPNFEVEKSDSQVTDGNLTSEKPLEEIDPDSVGVKDLPGESPDYENFDFVASSTEVEQEASAYEDFDLFGQIKGEATPQDSPIMTRKSVTFNDEIEEKTISDSEPGSEDISKGLNIFENQNLLTKFYKDLKF